MRKFKPVTSSFACPNLRGRYFRHYSSSQTFSGMSLLFLGTSSGVPTPERNVTSIALKLDGRTFLFDCGEGTQHQFQRCEGANISTVERVFITHLHGDHVLGLPGLIYGKFKKGADEGPTLSPTLHIYGPVGLREFVRTTIAITKPKTPMDVLVHQLLTPGQQVSARVPRLPGEKDIEQDPVSNTWNVHEDDTHIVMAASLSHTVPCWGYVVKEKDICGRLNVDLCKARGIQPGPAYACLKAGTSVVTSDGTLLHPWEVIGPRRIGRKVVILGDTCDSSQIVGSGQGADVVVHECTLPDEMVHVASARGHSSPSMAGAFARALSARRLILTHFSARFTSSASGENVGIQALVEAAAAAFGGPVLAAHDFLQCHLPKH